MYFAALRLSHTHTCYPHSPRLPRSSGELLPEPLDPDHPDTSPHNYHAVNDILDCSDHSPVFATFSLSIVAEGPWGGADVVAAAVEAAQVSGISRPLATCRTL